MKTVIRIIPLMLVSTWFWNSGVAAQTLPVGKGAIQQIAYSPDGALIAVADDSARVWLYDASTLKAVGVLQGHTRKVTAVAFSPDGRLLASGSPDKTVRLWDLDQHQELATLEHVDPVTSVAFSPDGRLLVSGGDKTIRLWDITQRKALGVLEGHTKAVTSVVFSPDGKILASGSWDKTIRLWDMEQQKELGVLEGHTGVVTSVVFSPDGKILASGSWDKTIRLWEVAQLQAFAVLKGHADSGVFQIGSNPDGVNSVAFSPDGKLLASGGQDKTVRLWDVAQRQETAVLQRHCDGVASVAFSPDGTRLASGGSKYDGTVRLWEVARLHEVAFFKHQDGGYLAVDTFHSPALNATKPYAIYLPPSYETSDSRHPAIYMLHQEDENFKAFIGLKTPIDRMTAAGELREVIVVFVDGGNSWYRGSYEPYIARDLVDHIDATYRTIPQRDSRGITGFGMGGYGALHLALKFPEIFSVAVPQAATGLSDIMGEVDSYLKQPVRLKAIKFVQESGANIIFLSQVRNFDKALTDLGIDHVYVEHNGAVTFIPEESLQFLSDRLSHEAPTAVLEEYTLTVPQSFALNQNFPNPFNSSTVIRFALPQNGEVELAVYNLAGQQVATLVEGVREAGTYAINWDGRDDRGHELASGLYLYRLRASGYVQTRKLLLLR